MEELIPIVMFAVIGVVLSLMLYFRYRTRREIQETIRTAIQSGQTFSAEMLQELTSSLTSKDADLRKGIISIALALALMVFGSLIGEEGAQGPAMGLSMFPLVLGVAYCGLWWFGKRREQ